MENGDDELLLKATADISKNYTKKDIRNAIGIAYQALALAEAADRFARPLMSWSIKAWRTIGSLYTSDLPETHWQKIMLDQCERDLHRATLSLQKARERGINRLDLLPTLMNSGVIDSKTTTKAAEIINEVNKQIDHSTLKK